MKLSKTQERALAKLSDNWRCAYALRERLVTLDSLVRKGLAEEKSNPGSLFSPRINIDFRLQKGK